MTSRLADIRLPGGVMTDDGVRKDVRFEQLTGMVELLAGECRPGGDCPAEAVSLVIDRAVASIGGREATRTMIDDLPVGDRQCIMRQLGIALGFDRLWLTCTCSSCQSGFDIDLRQSDLPTKDAGTGFPSDTATIGGRSRTIRVPTGADQAAISDIAGEEEAIVALLARIVDPATPAEIRSLDTAEITRLERMVERMSPEVSGEIVTACPECRNENRVAVDPDLWVDLIRDSLLAEVHVIASAYHWTEREILDLPITRRRRYLELLDRDRGMRDRLDEVVA